MPDATGKCPLPLAQVALAAAGFVAGVGAMKLMALTKPRDCDPNDTESRRNYEREAVARQYMEFHYTPSATSFAQQLPSITASYDFPERIARLCIANTPSKGRALDLGCACGASSFVLSSAFAEVVGIDLSSAFIRDAQLMQKAGTVKFMATEQGMRTVPRVATIPAGSHPDRIRFAVGDALSVDASYGTFDCILAANLVCRVPDPEKLFASIVRLMRPGGTLVLISPYSWTEEASPPSVWMGGHDKSAPSEEIVKGRLEGLKFLLVREGTEPFLIRDHVRRYQLGFSHCTIWRYTAQA